ncbi:ABC transporter permease [Silvibacterium dinghuense]|uniref:ABC transporter permease n=1 Tax=Silvibacterium dinghuense TaxID=1560006 RepID=A0A4Q1S7T7_9BACT|nr:ABC transporter permease [Silvibacterium dinghuense]RXS93026.1 ABC transporter permease [Silvibacterium dinghuense]GGG90061.1 hypothetical protein GCM10011586_00580 [Silvibacterium dinghuense]
MLTDLIYRLRSLISRQRVENELDEELQFHLEHEIKKHMARGASPAEAKRRAQIAIGGMEQVRQECRDARGTRLLEDLFHDLRFALRQLRRSPSFTMTAIVVFAFGVAASTTIFAFVDAAFIKPLPYHQPSRLVALFERPSVGDRFHLSFPDYQAWKAHNHVFSSLNVYRPERVTLKNQTGMEEISVASVSDGFFKTLGVSPFLGRDFRTGEDLASAPQTAILSYQTWQHRFGADKAVIGSTVEMDGAAYQIIGVLPPDFHFAPVGSAEFWKTIHGLCADNRFCYPYYGIARLKPGISLPTAAADIDILAKQIALAFPTSNRDRGATVLPLTHLILGDIRPTFLALLSGALLLALIGYVNIFSLLIVRAEARKREIAVRGALGASHIRLLRQFAVEGSVLAIAGGLLGLSLDVVLIRLMLGLIPRPMLSSMPYLEHLNLGWHVFGVALLAMALGALLFTLAPIAQLRFTSMRQGLSEGGRGAADRSWRRVGTSLVVVELMITVIMLTSAGLLAKSFYRLLHSDLGLRPDHLAVLHIARPGNPTDAQQISLEHKVIDQVTHLPGITSIGSSGLLAVGGDESFKAAFGHFRVFGRAYNGLGDEALSLIAGTGYFETLQARLLHGRYFIEADDASRPRVVIINQTMAALEFPGQNPIGQRLIDQYDPEHPYEIVGVIDDLKDGPLDMTRVAAVYSPFRQIPINDFYITVRTTYAPRTALHAIETAVHQIDPGLITDGEDTMQDRIDNSQSAYLHRSAASLVTGFALLALLLGTVGLYGVVAYSVGRRTREIGLRIALGAQRSSIYKLVLHEAFWLACLGLTGGLLGSIAAGMFLKSMLFEVRPWDPGTWFWVISALFAATLLASFIPARRAASIHPTESLRAE